MDRRLHGSEDALAELSCSRLKQKDNNLLYNIAGLKMSFSAFRPGGILAVWSSGPDRAFTYRLKRRQFQTENLTVRAHKHGKGARHTIWLARKP